MGSFVSASFDAKIFCGFPPALIAKWCSVTVEEATEWKEGRSTPSSSALALFCLYRDEKVLTDEFKNFIVRRGELVPLNGRGFSPAQLEAYELVYKIAMTYARPEVESHLERMKLAQTINLAPDVPMTPTLAPRWIWDPFYDPREGKRHSLMPESGTKVR